MSSFPSRRCPRIPTASQDASGSTGTTTRNRSPTRLYACEADRIDRGGFSHRPPRSPLARRLRFDIFAERGAVSLAERRMRRPMDVPRAVDELYRAEWGRILATLIGLLGDFELAEEAAQEAFAVALEQWASSGLPQSPRSWLIQTARHKAIDRLRRRTLIEQKLQQLTEPAEPSVSIEPFDENAIPDDRLRLIFTCCHPALAMEAQVGLTLRPLCGDRKR